MFDSISRVLERFSKFAIVFLFGVIVVLCLMQVTFRYLLDFPLVWAEEMMRLLFLWVIYFGIALCFNEESHIVISIVYDRLSLKWQKYFKTAIDSLSVLFLILIFILGLKINWFVRAQGLPVTGIPVYLLYFSFSLGMLISIFFAIHLILKPRGKS